MEVAIDDRALSPVRENGRYELYPTQNIYTFILLDTKFGRTYQVQWNTDPKKRFVEQINQSAEDINFTKTLIFAAKEVKRDPGGG